MLKNFVAFFLFLALGLGEVMKMNGMTIEIDHENHIYRFQNKENVWSEWKREKGELFLKLGTFDPLESPQNDLTSVYANSILKDFPSFPASFLYTSQNEFPGTFFVQFKTQAFPVYREILEEMGVKVLFPFPSQAFIVSIPSSKVHEQLKQKSFVRWVGSYSPIYKVDSDIISLLSSEKSTKVVFNVMAVERGLKMQNKIEQLVQQLGGKVLSKVPEGFRMEIELGIWELGQILKQKEVLFADLWTAPGEDMDIARQFGGLDYLTTVYGYSGEGVRAEVMDSGLYTSHTDFAGLNVKIHGGNGGSTSHGTSVFGVVFGQGTTNPNALGGMPQANASIFAAYSLLGGSYTRYRHTQELVDPDGDYRAIFQTNSWGNSQTTSYTTISAEMDDIIYQYDITILQSQSNTGNRNSRPQAWAKNIVSVGAFYHYNTLSRADDRWGSGASIGPATDGRQKPDLCHFYDQILTTSNSNNGYTQFGGTSGATPITAGHFGIFYQMWADGVFSGSTGRSRDVFESRPHSSTAKAVMINSAKQFAFNENTRDLLRAHQGWGTADIERLHGNAQINKWTLPLLIDESQPISNGEVLKYSVSVDSSSAPNYLKVTLVYRDPMPSPSSSRQLINNLDLGLISPSGKLFWGNHGLSKGPCSEEEGEPSEIDNVENVFICEAESGTWTVQVIGTSIVQDTYPSTKDVDAVFSLVATKGRND